MDAKTLQLAAGLTPALAMKWAAPVTAAMDKFGVDTPARVAAFLAQIGHESAGFMRLRESFDYSVEGLRKTFRDRISAEVAARLGRQPHEQAVPLARQQTIANLVYGGRFGNNTTGDGWRYRGGGLKQITFRANYGAARDAIGVDIVTEPDRITDPVVAALTAGWFWFANGCSRYADVGDFDGLTRKINGGLNGLDERKARWAVAKKALGVA